jgi:DNA-binding NtrC family response regulator
MDNANGITKPRLLLVESNEFIRNALRTAFERSGYSIVAVETARDGSQVLNDDCLDVVISDYELMDSTGLNFLVSLKNVCPNKTNVLMITYGDLDNISETKNCGIHHIIEKPFPFEELLRIVKNSRLKN